MSTTVLSAVAQAAGLVLFSKSLSNDNTTSSIPTTTSFFTTSTPGVPKRPWVSNHTAQDILTYTHFTYPLILLAWFIAIFTYESIASSGNTTTAAADTPGSPLLGPGGKPLPDRSNKASKPDQNHLLDFSRPRKLLFIWLSVAALFTFFGNGLVTIIHALYGRNEEWWCGQAYVVRWILSRSTKDAFLTVICRFMASVL